MRATELWQLGARGQDVVVAILDSGVDADHPDLAASYRGGDHGWFDPYGEHAEPFDATGHGTRVAGIIAGGDAGGSPVGVAPRVRWIAAKVFNDAGATRYSAIHAALRWVLDPDGDPATDDAPDVVNASFSLANVGSCDGEFHADLDALRTAGILTVFAAGSYGPALGTSVSPANDPLVLSVGAADESGTVLPSSSRGPSACTGGPYPAIFAPGGRIRTTDLSPHGAPLYAFASGTSVAAPHVAGALALLLSAFPGAIPDHARDALLAGAADGAPDAKGDHGGPGRLDALAAYALLGADRDGDGAPFAFDCDDTDGAVHPGRLETKHDGVDQDCSGGDLTIDLVAAVYDPLGRALRVEATSALGPAAALHLAGFGPMRWDERRGRWFKAASGVGADPGVVTVSGAEGSESAATTRRR